MYVYHKSQGGGYYCTGDNEIVTQRVDLGKFRGAGNDLFFKLCDSIWVFTL